MTGHFWPNEPNAGKVSDFSGSRPKCTLRDETAFRIAGSRSFWPNEPNADRVSSRCEEEMMGFASAQAILVCHPIVLAERTQWRIAIKPAPRKE
jgi:hypothetical protein